MTITSPISLLTPLKPGLSIRVTQAPGGTTSHDGDLYYGWDFAAAAGSLLGAEVLAIADGTVVFIEESVPDGDAASGSFGADGSTRDSSLGLAGALGNVVTIEHTVDGQVFYASYLHLGQNSVPLEVGDTVTAAQVIGLVGNTGYRTGTHLQLNIGETLGPYTNPAGYNFPH
jgi:murein DD-endopeptidase MepM/ murein hydrolase activator NlpD